MSKNKMKECRTSFVMRNYVHETATHKAIAPHPIGQLGKKRLTIPKVG